MAVPMPVPPRQGSLSVDTTPRPSIPPDVLSPPFATASRPNLALTILKGFENAPISAYSPIAKKSDAQDQHPRQSQRFATSFASLRERSADSATHTVQVHAVSDDGILLPFIDRPEEVEELLFETKANQALMHRLCRVFGGDTRQPLLRGTNEAWDQLLEILIGVDRPILDDEDWLKTLETSVLDRSPELWAQLQRCLGAEGIVLPSSAHPRPARYDNWADPESRDDAHFHAARSRASTLESGASTNYEHDTLSAGMSVEALHELPRSFYKHNAGQIQGLSVHEDSSFSSKLVSIDALQDSEQTHRRSSLSSSGMFAMSGSDSNFGGALSDILEEPTKGSTSQAFGSRQRSYSGKFAGLRISASTHHEVRQDSRRSSISLSPGRGRESPSSPLPTGVMSPPMPSGDKIATSFSKHRRLSVLLPSTAETPSKSLHGSPPSTHQVGRHDRSASSPSSPAVPSRKRALSFARSFAELHSDLAGEQRTPAKTFEMSQLHSSLSASSGKPTSQQGPLHDVGNMKATASFRSRAASVSVFRDAGGDFALSTGQTSFSDKGVKTKPIPGLLPDGRTRHPSGSLGSKDLSESIAAFRATMGLSASPGQSERHSVDSDDGLSEKAITATKKRKELATDMPQKNVSASGKIARSENWTSSARDSTDSTAEPLMPTHMHEMERKMNPGGSGLALGGGFSLAKSGSNFKKSEMSGRKASHEKDSVDWSSYRGPPLVSRRPGGFVSLAQEYESARRSRRSATESGSIFSLHSNALASSPSSSIASLDVDWPPRVTAFHEPQALPKSSRESSAGQEAVVPLIRMSPATPSETVESARPTQGPFDHDLTPSSSLHDIRSPSSPKSEVTGQSTPDTVQTTPLPSPISIRSRPILEPSSQATCFAPRSPSIVFPISPNPAVSRAGELTKLLDRPAAEPVLKRVAEVCGQDVMSYIRQLIERTERQQMADEELLEAIGKRMRLVDHERAFQQGGREQEEADNILAEEGYEDRWQAFYHLCKTLGVGDYELGMAKRRCGPAIDLSKK